MKFFFKNSRYVPSSAFSGGLKILISTYDLEFFEKIQMFQLISMFEKALNPPAFGLTSTHKS
jgi:hypothetical protein